MKESESEVAQSCPTLWDPMDCSLTGFSVHGIFQARMLEWVTISFSRRSSRPRDWTWVFRIVGRCFTIWATSYWKILLCSVQISSVLLFSPVRLFETHGLEHARLPCLSPTPRVYSDSCPLSWWCHPTISSSSPSPPTFNLSQHQGLFKWVNSSHQVANVLEFQLQQQSFKWIFRTDFL